MRLVPHQRDLVGWHFPRGSWWFPHAIARAASRILYLKQESHDSKKEKTKNKKKRYKNFILSLLDTRGD